MLTPISLSALRQLATQVVRGLRREVVGAVHFLYAGNLDVVGAATSGGRLVMPRGEGVRVTAESTVLAQAVGRDHGRAGKHIAHTLHALVRDANAGADLAYRWSRGLFGRFEIRGTLTEPQAATLRARLDQLRVGEFLFRLDAPRAGTWAITPIHRPLPEDVIVAGPVLPPLVNGEDRR